MKRLSFLRSRRGVAIESAIFTMLMVFALCSIILTVSMYMIQNQKQETEDFNERIFVDQLGEDFLYAVRSGATYHADTDYTDGVDNSYFSLDDNKVFDPDRYTEEYLDKVNSDTQRLHVALSVSAGQYVLTLEKTTVYVTEAVRDEDGNIIREETSSEVRSHLLTVILYEVLQEDVTTYELVRWSYIK